MRKKNLNWLLALLAALALVFAFAGCADNGAGDGNTTNPSDEEEEEDTPCCDITDCTPGSGCTACDSCSDCSGKNCCGADACTVTDCGVCTGGKDCTGTSECTVCDDCACTECSETQVDYAANYYNTEWSATANKATDEDSAMSLTEATLSFGSNADANATLELTIVSDNASYNAENYDTWTLTITASSWRADEDGVTVTLPTGGGDSNVTALNLVLEDEGATLRLDSVTKSDENDASYVVSFSSATKGTPAGDGGAATSESTADLFDLDAGSLVAGADNEGTEFAKQGS